MEDDIFDDPITVVPPPEKKEERRETEISSEVETALVLYDPTEVFKEPPPFFFPNL